MNLSNKRIHECRERNGEAASERPNYVNEALEQEVKVGYASGLPVVTPPQGYDETPSLGDSVSSFYEHYPRSEQLLWPNSRVFIQALYDSEHIGDDVAAASELAVDVSEIKEARNLFNIETSKGGIDEQESTDTFVLPSGETWNLQFLDGEPHEDSRILTQMMATDGMSLNEVYHFVNAQGFECSQRDVREAAYECGLIRDEPEPEASNAMRLGRNDKLDSGP